MTDSKSISREINILTWHNIYDFNLHIKNIGFQGNKIDNKGTTALLLDPKDKLKDRVGSTYRRATTDNKNFVRSIPGGQGKGVYYLQ